MARVIGIFNPIDDGVGRIGFRRPLRRQGHIAVQLAAEGELGIILIPAIEGVAGTNHRFGGLHGGAVGLHKHGGHISAALGIIGNPVAGFHLGPQGHVLRAQGNAVHTVGQGCLGIPAGDAFVSRHREGHVRSDLVARDALLRGIHAPAQVHEEHIVYLGKAGRQRHGPGLRDVGLHTKAGEGGVALIPAEELVAFHLRGGRRVQGIACLHNLRADSFLPVHEGIGNVASAPILNGQQRGARLHMAAGFHNFSYRGQRHAA